MRKAIGRYAEHYGLRRRLRGDASSTAEPRRHRSRVLRELLLRRAPDDTITASDLLAVHRLVGCGAHPSFHAGVGFDRASPGEEPSLPPHPTQAFDQLAMRLPDHRTVVVTLFRLVPHDSTYDIFQVQLDGATVATTYAGAWTGDGDEGCIVTVQDVLRVEMHGQRGLHVAMPTQKVDLRTTGGGPVVAVPEPVMGNRGYELGCAGFAFGDPAGAVVAGVRRWGTHGGTVGLSSWLHHRLYEGWVGHAAAAVPLDLATYTQHTRARLDQAPAAAVSLQTAGRHLIIHLATPSHGATTPPHDSGKTQSHPPRPLLSSTSYQDKTPERSTPHDSPVIGRVLLLAATCLPLLLGAALVLPPPLAPPTVGLILGLALLLLP